MAFRTLRHTLIALMAVLCALLPAPVRGANAPKPAPDFELTDLSGSTHRLAGYRGRVVVLNFWATWCPECLVELPSLNTFADRYRDRGVVVLGISIDRSEDALRVFVKDHPLRYPVVMDTTGEAFVRKFLIRGLPATIVIDREGRISATLMGAQEFTDREFTKRIDGLLDPGGKGPK